MTDWRTIAAHLADDADTLLTFDAHGSESHNIQNLLDTAAWGGSTCTYCYRGRQHFADALRESIDAFDAATKAAEDALAAELEASR